MNCTTILHNVHSNAGMLTYSMDGKRQHKQESQKIDTPIFRKTFNEQGHHYHYNPLSPNKPRSVMSCIDHINVFGCFNCHQDVCNALLVPDNEQAMTALMQPHTLWPIGFICSFVSLLIHTHANGHDESSVQVAIRAKDQKWNIDIFPHTRKLIILELASSDYTITVANFDDTTIQHINGHFPRVISGGYGIIGLNISNAQQRHTIQKILASSRIENHEEWTFICRPYLRQSNHNVACGPIVILAFHREYFGESLLEEVMGNLYQEDLRPRLVEWYIQRFRREDQYDRIRPPKRMRLDATPWREDREARQQGELNVNVVDF